MSPQEQVESYLHFLFDKAPDSSVIDVRYTGPSVRVIPRPVQSNLDVTANAMVLSAEKGWNVYVGALPRIRPGSSLEWADTLWVDIDGGFHAPDDAQGLLTQACIDRKIPGWNLRVESGTGIHAYWKLKEPVDLTNLKERSKFESVLKRTVLAIGGKEPFAHADPGCAEPARILRPPGTVNWKYRFAPVRVNCWTAKDKWYDNIYTLDEWDSFLVQYTDSKSELKQSAKEQGELMHASVKNPILKNGQSVRQVYMFGKKESVEQEIESLLINHTPVGRRHRVALRLDALARNCGYTEVTRKDIRDKFCKLNNFPLDEYNKLMQYIDKKGDGRWQLNQQ